VHVLIGLGLALIVLLPFGQTLQFDFVHYDDRNYIMHNANIQQGFSLESIRWAFTSLLAYNWHPLTWLSLMLDHSLYGLWAGGYHATNVLLHLANTLLLFLVFGRMTGELWKSGLVAALFAVHPLHVESVAWIMERKDVLSTLFWLLTIGSYAAYAGQPSPQRYLRVSLCFLLGLMSKAMLVTLPIVLLLMDYWPLGRHENGAWTERKRLVLEKLPWFALSGIVGVVTIYAQKQSGALQSLADYPFSDRLINAAMAYGGYIAKMLWPTDLSFFYPYPDSFSAWALAPSMLLLVCFSLFAVRFLRQAPYLAVGWLWYMVTLLPVSGLIQTGMQAMADRYTYVPLIGLFIVMAWGIPALAGSGDFRKRLLAVSAVVIVLVLAMQTYRQTGVWRDSRTLFEHAIAVTQKNDVAHNNLGLYFMDHKRFPEAAEHFRQTAEIKPLNAKYWNNLGIAFYRQNRYEEAVAVYRKAMAVDPRLADSYYNAADAFFFGGREAEALEHYKKALSLRPGNAVAENNIAALLIRRGQMDEALVFLRAAVLHRPSYAEAHNNLGAVLARLGHKDEAVKHIREALRLDPGYMEARDNLMKLTGLGPEAETH
jgi:tetratricopeptide (TPR) repeat protein